MRTRTTVETEVFVLMLNDMRHSRIETLTPAAFSDDPEKLRVWMNEQRFEWADGQWRKRFRAGAPLEWFNDHVNGFGGIEQRWVPSDEVTRLEADPRWIR